MNDSEGELNEFESLFGFAPIDVRVCRPRLRVTILEGGSAKYSDGKNTRVLDAGRAIQPLIHTVRMSGFLGLIQPLLAMATPQYIKLEIYAGRKREVGDRPIWEQLYKRSELATAIERFLQGASPSAQVVLWRAR